MIGHKDYSFGRLLLRAVLPSPLSGVLCVGFGVLLVGTYMVVQSLSIGTSLPKVLDGQWSISYTNNIVQPLLTFFTDFKTENALVILGWGLLGLAVYMLLELGTRTLRDLRTAEHNIQITDRAVLRHVGMKAFFTEALWRLGVLVVFGIIFALGISPVAHELATIAPQAVLGDLAQRQWPQLLLLAAELALLAHAGVVFLRLFLSRVRLFSDDPI
jgi:hypothetical protein